MLLSVRWLLVQVFLLMISVNSFAQPGRTGNAIVPFKVRLVDGSVFSATQLKPKTGVIMVYFDPDCDHCKTFAGELLKHYSRIKNKQVVMVTWFDMNKVNRFDKELKLSTHANIKIGSEGTSLVMQKYYNIQQLPFIALYNKKGEKTAIYEGSAIPVDKVLAAIDRL